MTRRWRVGGPEVQVAGSLEPLTPIEVRLLERLVAAGARPVSRETLLQEVWDYSPTVQTRAVHHAVTRLRKKLGKRSVETVRGAGYRLGDGWELVERPVPMLPVDGGPTRGLEGAVAAAEAALEGAAPVALVGLAGSGRTRLAREVARGHADVVWVEAAGADGDALAGRVARALGLERPSGAAIARVLGHRGRVLLVLDDVEQPEVLAELGGTWLAEGRGARILATTRGAVPDGVRGVPLTGLGPEAAVALYRDRVPAGLTVNPTAVERLVGLLDGHPRAIVLAATRAALLPADRLATRIATDPEADGGPLAAIRAAVATSWELLPPEARELAVVASVFEGRFTAVDLAQVADVSEEEVAERMQPLLEGGLVLPEAGGVRFGQWVRRHARDELARSGRRAAVEAAHTAWVRERCDQARRRLHGPEHDRGMTTLGRLRAEVRAVLDRARGEGAHALAAGLLGAMDPWCGVMLAPADHAAQWDGVDVQRLPEEARALALRHRAHGRIRAGRLDGVLEDVLRAEQGLSDPDHRAGCRALRVGLALGSGRLEEARELVRQPVEGASARPLFVLASLRGTSSYLDGDLDGAEEAYADALALSRRSGELPAQGLALCWLGSTNIQRGQLDRAVRWFEEAIRVLESLGSSEALASAHGNIGVCRLETGRLDEARERYTRSLEVARSAGSASLEHTARMGLAIRWLLLDEPVRALTELEAVDREEGPPHSLYAELAAYRALAQERSGMTSRSGATLERARELTGRTPEPSPAQVLAAVEAILAKREVGRPPSGATAVVRLAHRLGGFAG